MKSLLAWLILILLVVSLAGCTSQSVLSSQQIELHDGRVIKDTIFSFEDNTFVLAKNGQISKDKIKTIKFIKVVSETEPFGKDHTVLDSNVQAYLAQAEEANKKYPEANGIILLNDTQVILNPDGTRKARYHFVGKILTNQSIDWGSNTLYLEEERVRVKVVLARTITPEGQIYELDQSDIKISEPARSMRFFGGGKLMSFTLPQVKVGNLVEFISEYETFSPWDKNIFEAGMLFQGTEPVLRARLTVTIPDNLELNYYARHMPPESARPIITKNKGMTAYAWEMTNLEAIITEPAMPSIFDVAPYLTCTLFKDWNYLFDCLSRIHSERIKVTPAIEETVQELTQDAPTIEEKIAALYHFVQRQIRYVSIKGSMSSNWGGHPAQQTLQNKYGDCIDKAILFTTMLKVIEVEAYPILVATNGRTPVREIPVVDANHALNEIHLEGRVFYLDPVTWSYRYPYFSSSDHGTKAINPLARKINFIEVPPPQDNMKSYHMEMTIEPDGQTEVDSQADYTGYYEASVRGFWGQLPETERWNRLQQHVNSISPGAKLTELEFVDIDDISKPLKLIYKYSLPSYPVLAGNLMIFGIPNLEYSFPEIALDERKYDVRYDSSQNLKHDVTIAIPEGYEIKHLPELVKLECLPYATYEGFYEYQTGYIIFKDDFKRFERIIPAKDYQAYKKFLQDVAKFSREKIFLIKKDK